MRREKRAKKKGKRACMEKGRRRAGIVIGKLINKGNEEKRRARDECY